MIEAPGKSYLDRAHSSLEPLHGRANVQELELKGFSPELRQQLRVAMLSFPEPFRVPVKDPPAHRATVITPESLPSSTLPTQGVIWGPGFEGTAASNVHLAAKLFDELPKHLKDSQLGLVASLSSSFSADTRNWRYPQSHLERATHFAALITELVKKNPYPLDKLKLVFHSLSAMEASYMIPMLRSLLRQNDIKTQIDGVILAQPAGLYDQGNFNFLSKRMPEVVSFNGEIAEMFPSPLDFQRVENKLKHDETARQELDEMEQKKITPNLTEDQKTALLAIDNAIESSKNADGRMTKSLLRQRRKLLKPVIQKVLQGADLRGKPTIKERAQYSLNMIQFVMANFLPGKKGMTRALPEPISKALDDIPVAMIFGEQDPYFKLDEYQKYLEDQRTKGKEPLFTQAKRFIAHIAGWPHIGVVTNTTKFSRIVGDIFRKMDEEAQESSGKNQEVVNLNY